MTASSRVPGVPNALDRLILSTAKDAAAQRYCDLVVAMIVDRLIAPRSKLGFVRAVDAETATTTLGVVLGLGAVKEREAYEALDWLLARQERIENGLARRHLRDGVLVLYDVSSSYFAGRCCPLAQHGYSRDHRGDRPQIVYGLLCTRAGLPVAVEVFAGNAADPATLSAQVGKLKRRFGLSRVVLVGDRGMITSAPIGEDLRPAGLDWVTCLRAPAIQALATETGPLQLSLFDERDLAEISAPEMFPGERLIVCRNRELAAERQRKREALLAATERDLARIQAHVRRKHAPLRGAAAIGMAVGAVINNRKVGKHLTAAIDGDVGHWTDEEAALGGALYAIAFQTQIELWDATQAKYGFSPNDVLANSAGTLYAVAQELYPAAERVKPTFSYWPTAAYRNRRNFAPNAAGAELGRSAAGNCPFTPPPPTPPAPAHTGRTRRTPRCSRRCRGRREPGRSSPGRGPDR